MAMAVPRLEARDFEEPELDQEQRIVVPGVEWEDYLKARDALDRHWLRFTYLEGTLEIMSPSGDHERRAFTSGRFVEILAEDFELPFEPRGSMTFRREDLKRGLEPDQCFWLRNEPLVRGQLVWKPEIHPPPDLVIEVEVSRSALDRIGIYAALGVPEVWRVRRDRVIVLSLQEDGEYRQVEASPTFPTLPMGELPEFFLDTSSSWFDLIRSFRAWAQKHRSAGGRP
jgi:Uma2 family endonuclease